MGKDMPGKDAKPLASGLSTARKCAIKNTYRSHYGAVPEEDWGEYGGAMQLPTIELELGLIRTHMAQKPVLRVEVGERALRVRSVS